MDREAWTIVWTIIGVGVALLGVLLPFNLYLMHGKTKALQDSLLLLITRVENRIDQLEQNRQADMARLEQSLQADIARLEQSLQADIARLEQRLQADMAQLEQRLQADIVRLEQNQARLEQSLQTVTAKMERGLEAQHKELQAIGERTARIEGALTGPWNARNGETMSAARVSPQET